MKKLIPLLLVVLTFAAYEKDPDTDKLDNKYLVYKIGRASCRERV